MAARSAHWPLLDATEQERLGELADHVVRTKRWEAAKGQELTDEVRTLVAGHAALLALGLDDSAFDRVGTIVVRSRAMRRTAPMAGPAQGVLMDAPGAVDGEAHHADGPIMLVWPSARREARNPRLGRDVVLHEFSHKLDMLDGTIDGTPPMDGRRPAPALDRGVHRRVPGRARRARADRSCGPTPARTRASSSPSPRRRSSPGRSSCRTPSRRCTTCSPRSTARTRRPDSELSSRTGPIGPVRKDRTRSSCYSPPGSSVTSIAS